MKVRGRIVKAIAGIYYIHSNDLIYECRAKGIFRKKKIHPLVGDFAVIEILDDKNRLGNLIEIEKRKNSLNRPQVANIDQMLIVFAVTSPKPNLNTLDKFLILLEKEDIDCIIVFNKDDLADCSFNELLSIYSKCYKVFSISVKDERGLDNIKRELEGKTTAIAGPSGVGKSSLINYLVPNVNREVGDLSRKIERGKQTTREVELFTIAADTYILDTPGFTSLELSNIKKEELANYFRDFSSIKCRFSSCRHIKESDCKIKEAVESSLISKSRYENYRLIYKEIEDRRGY